MPFQCTHPWLLLLLPVGAAWVVWLSLHSDVQISSWRKWSALAVRLVGLLALVLALAGLRWLRPLEGMNVFFLLDRSDSIPSAQQELARDYVNRSGVAKDKQDMGGVVVFGSEAAIETMPNAVVDVKKIQSVVGVERTDMAAALRLGTAAFPETGQKRLVLLSDGNENLGDAMSAVMAARPLGVTLDVVPMGVSRRGDVSVQKISVPSRLKRGQTFDARIFIQSDQPQKAKVHIFRNDQPMGSETVELQPGKNLFTFPQTLSDPGFYSYDVRVEAPGDTVAQNNRASTFTTVQGDPRAIIVSSDPDQDRDLADALRVSRMDVKLAGLTGMPGSLAEMQSYDVIFLSNVEAGSMGRETMLLLDSAVRDFGIGLVCVGGDRSYAAGGYRGTPLESTLPVSMELDSKKVLPPGAVVLVMHGMEFNNGNQVARDCALGVLNALGPQDEMGIVLWDGSERWVFELQKVGNKKELGRQIAGMNQGDLGSFQGVMEMAHDALKKSRTSLKHIIVFSDGDPSAPRDSLMADIAKDRITVSTVLIAGHAGPDTMIKIAEQGRGHFYNVTSPQELPQIFIKETAVILKSAISEDPFKPQVRGGSEITRGIAAGEFPQLQGYVATSAKPRAETPLWTTQGDPLLAHWQYGLGRVAAFTSDARSRWARDWLGWTKYRQFWSQTAQWCLRRVENADFSTEVTVDKGEGAVVVDAMDDKGEYRNFLNLQAAVVSPKGERFSVRLEQTGPGHYEARFPTRDTGVYLLNLMDLKDGRPRASQVVGASVSFSPEFSDSDPNRSLLRRLADSGGGRVLDPTNPGDNPFLHDRKKTFQPRDLWEWLLKLAILLFPIDVGIRRIQIDRDEWSKAAAAVRRRIFFWRDSKRAAEADESLTALLNRRDQVRSTQTAAGETPAPELFKPRMETATPVVLPVQQEPVSQQEAAAPEDSKEKSAKPAASDSMASKLLEAKRRARDSRK